MRIAYLFHLAKSKTEQGVLKKVVGQTNNWKALGNEVLVLQVTGDNEEVEGRTPEGWFRICYRRSSIYERMFSCWKTALEAIRKYEPDIVYFRYDVFTYPVWRMMKAFKVVTELNTDDTTEFCEKLNGRCMYNFLTRRFILKSSKGLVFVSHELSKKQAFSGFKKPSIVIGNGISVNKYRILPLNNSTDKSVNLCFVGSESKRWHGVDKIIELAKIKSEWNFHLIGISKNHNLRNVISYGFLDENEYLPILEKCDVAIGSLALHRIGIDEISPLKLREYLACGLPSIIGYKDTDFLTTNSFILQLPNTEDNLVANIERIESFINSWKGKRVPRDLIAHIDWAFKEKLRLEFFESIVREMEPADNG